MSHVFDTDSHQNLHRLKPNVIPGSDMAGTVAAVGDGVQHWKAGDRVSVNFTIDHLDGDVTLETGPSGLGAPIDGVLKEYLVVPQHVSSAIVLCVTVDLLP
jgi:NADPH:quinone reductase-like Zn-dependent oxidoreductase